MGDAATLGLGEGVAVWSPQRDDEQRGEDEGRHAPTHHGHGVSEGSAWEVPGDGRPGAANLVWRPGVG